ncbi:MULTISPECIES: DUF1810 family protein [unclassified Methylobacterium]|uniref:DUF1810 family protein n=1 Tax=unclassified Methylobacterium TaxID=2615210 RepID=UPI002484AFFD|nr:MULTISPECIES: DUF1810 family protein [unclassified Methylobacterium]
MHRSRLCCAKSLEASSRFFNKGVWVDRALTVFVTEPRCHSVCSSMTLFGRVALDIPAFREALTRYYGGKDNPRICAKLGIS